VRRNRIYTDVKLREASRTSGRIGEGQIYRGDRQNPPFAREVLVRFQSWAQGNILSNPSSDCLALFLELKKAPVYFAQTQRTDKWTGKEGLPSILYLRMNTLTF